MILVFDMDNTLADELGQSARPGIRGLLRRCQEKGHTMIIWTSSTKDRAEGILKDLGLAPFFARLIAREDYDPANAGRIKNVKSVKADWFIDDDPKQVEAARKSGVKCLLVPAYRRRHKLPPDDIEVIEKALLG